MSASLFSDPTHWTLYTRPNPPAIIKSDRMHPCNPTPINKMLLSRNPSWTHIWRYIQIKKENVQRVVFAFITCFNVSCVISPVWLRKQNFLKCNVIGNFWSDPLPTLRRGAVIFVRSRMNRLPTISSDICLSWSHIKRFTISLLSKKKKTLENYLHGRQIGLSRDV